ncbi:MAG: hypothetical protein ACJ72L_13340 [Marmoricola sp.]
MPILPPFDTYANDEVSLVYPPRSCLNTSSFKRSSHRAVSDAVVLAQLGHRDLGLYVVPNHPVDLLIRKCRPRPKLNSCLFELALHCLHVDIELSSKILQKRTTSVGCDQLLTSQIG